MINLDAIHKDNIKYEPFEHLLVDFIDADFIKSAYKEYKESTVVVTKFDEFNNMFPHPAQDLLDEHHDEIVRRINDLWDLDIATVSMGTAMFDKNSKLDVHNDYNYDGNFSIPARGIIYLNEEKVFGTSFHEYEDGPGKEMGGMPGQLLLFKVSPNSWHSAGVDVKSDFRITCNWLLNRVGSPH